MILDLFFTVQHRVDAGAAPALVLMGYFKDLRLKNSGVGLFGLIIKRRPVKPDNL